MRGRDRTAEFIATINSKRDKPQYIQRRRQQQQLQQQQQPINPLVDASYKELMRVSLDCSHRIRDSCEKLERFTQLARKRALFDDGELNKLIGEIRTDIEETKSKLDYLQSKNDRDSKQKHTGNIVSILQRKLAHVTSNFKSTLESRSRSVQQQTARHELYAGPTVSSSSKMNSYQPNGPVVLDMMNGRAGSSSLLQPNHHSGMQMQQTLQMNDQIDLAERAEMMHIVESTIVELGTMFNQLAHIVHDQGETITRIDMNISESTANVEAAHDALLRYFASINSNRWLILKVFGVLFFFFVITVVFSS